MVGFWDTGQKWKKKRKEKTTDWFVKHIFLSYVDVFPVKSCWFILFHFLNCILSIFIIFCYCIISYIFILFHIFCYFYLFTSLSDIILQYFYYFIYFLLLKLYFFIFLFISHICFFVLFTFLSSILCIFILYLFIVFYFILFFHFILFWFILFSHIYLFNCLHYCIFIYFTLFYFSYQNLFTLLFWQNHDMLLAIRSSEDLHSRQHFTWQNIYASICNLNSVFSPEEKVLYKCIWFPRLTVDKLVFVLSCAGITLRDHFPDGSFLWLLRFHAVNDPLPR